jgi:hypothetical protein
MFVMSPGTKRTLAAATPTVMIVHLMLGSTAYMVRGKSGHAVG